jgi:DNA-binding LacI/PurR family transcriptional regulator
MSNKNENILGETDRSRGNKYAAVADILLERIHNGDYGAMLPGKRALATEFEVTTVTMAKAIDLLKENGVVRTEKGRGTFVTRLKRSRTHTLGLVQNTFAHDAYLHSQLLSSLQERSQEIGERIVAQAHKLNAQSELTLIKQLVENIQVDGILLWPCENNTETIDYLETESIPYVLLPEPDIDFYSESSTVSADDAGAALRLMEHLIATGYKKIGFLANDDFGHSAAMQQRYSQYMAALNTAGLKTTEPIFNITPEWLRECDAVFASTDRLAASVLTCCAEHRISMPHDLAIAGYDNSKLAKALNFTSVEQHFEKIGRKAIDVLMDEIEERRDTPVHVTVDSELMVRWSTSRKQDTSKLDC